MNRLNPSFPSCHSGLGKKLSPPKWSEVRCLGKSGRSKGHLGSGLLRHCPSSPSLPTLPRPHKGSFQTEPFLRKMKGLKVWPISASVTPTAWKREDPSCQGNLDFRLRRQWRLLGLPSHSHAGPSGSPHSRPGPGCWPLPLPWANRAPPSQGRESYCLPGHCGSLVVAHILRNFCFPLIPALPSTPFVINDIHLTPCRLPRTFHVISHLIVGPVLAVGRGSVQQSSEIRSLRAETSQVSGSFRDPRPGPFPSAQLLWSRVHVPMGPKRGTLWSSSRRTLGQPGAFSSFKEKPSFRPRSPLVSLRDTPCPLLPLIIWLLPPSPATASGTNSSNTPRIVRVPCPLRHAVSCLCAFAHAVSLDWNAFPLLLLPCLPGKYLLISHNPPQRPPPLGRKPPCPFPPRLPLLFVNASLWHLAHCILLVYMFVSPSRL